MMRHYLLSALALAVSMGSAHAQITVDGARDTAYGSATETIGYDPSVSSSNFAGSPASNSTAYNFYLNGSDGYVYGLVEATTATGLNFANVYFDLDYATRSGSDLGFELGVNNSANIFIPGGTVGGAIGGVSTALSSDGRNFEFAIPVSYFTSAYPGLTYNPALTFPTAGGSIRVNLLQAFGYSVQGGSSFGTDRLGIVGLTSAAGAVPEPASWALMILGLGMTGSALRRRQARPVPAAA